jgi:hypothetical protein
MLRASTQGVVKGFLHSLQSRREVLYRPTKAKYRPSGLVQVNAKHIAVLCLFDAKNISRLVLS